MSFNSMDVATLAREWIDHNEFAVFHRLATVATTKNLGCPFSLNGVAVKLSGWVGEWVDEILLAADLFGVKFAI